MTKLSDWVPFGFLPIFKPVGPTSHDIVAKIRRLLPRGVKVGHTGTLDPFAEGVLIISVGKATKFTDAVHELPKQYTATLRLGIQTDTLDPTGTITEKVPVPAITAEQIDQASAKFLGRFPQMPPIYSAKKVGGKKSYELARRNQAVTLEPRTVEIMKLDLRQQEDDLFWLDTTCATGTYIRALGRDIAAHLGTVGHLEGLKRTAIGPIAAEACVRMEDLSIETLPQHLIQVSALLPQYPEVALPNAAYGYFIDGRSFNVKEPLPQQFLAVFKIENDQVAAIFRCEYRTKEQLVAPRLLCYLNPAMQT